MSRTSCFDRISEKADDRHRAYPARDRSECASYRACAFKIHVASKSESSLVFDAIDSHVDDDCTRLDPITADEVTLPYGSYKDMGATTRRRKIFSLGVCDRDGALFLAATVVRAAFPLCWNSLQRQH